MFAVLISAPIPPNPPLGALPPWGKGGGADDCRSISSFFCWGGGGRALTNIQVFGFIFVIFTQFTQKCIANDICDRPAHFFTVTGSFFHFPPAGSTNKRVGKVTRLSYPIDKEINRGLGILAWVTTCVILKSGSFLLKVEGVVLDKIK